MSNSDPAGQSPVAVQALASSPGRWQLLWRGVTRRCPWCGSWRAYFRGWFKRQDRCVRCGHGYRRGDHAFELGAVTANIILTFLGVLIALLLTILLVGEVGWVVGVAAAVALIGPLVFYPVSFTLWQAIDLWMRPPTAAELAGEGDAHLYRRS